MKKLTKILLGTLLILVLGACGTKNKVDVNAGELEKNIEIRTESVDAVENNKSYLILTINNKNQINVDLEIKVDYFDKQNNLLGTNILNKIEGLAPNQIVAYSTKGLKVFENVDRFKVSTKTKESKKESIYSSLTLESEDTKENIKVTLDNKSESQISRSQLICVYYRDKKPVSLVTKDVAVVTGKQDYIVNYPEVNDVFLTFDSYKVYINKVFK